MIPSSKMKLSLSGAIGAPLGVVNSRFEGGFHLLTRFEACDSGLHLECSDVRHSRFEIQWHATINRRKVSRCNPDFYNI